MSAQRTEVQTRLARANEEEREIKANLQQYQALAARGIVGEEKRLDWIDTITAIKNERQLFNISYNIEPQKPLDYPGFARRRRRQFPGQPRENRDCSYCTKKTCSTSSTIWPSAADRTSRCEAATCSASTAAAAQRRDHARPRLQAACVFDLITIRHNKPA